MAKHEITLVLDTGDNELSADGIRRIGRDAAHAVLRFNGSGVRDADLNHRQVESVRFNEFYWVPSYYMEDAEGDRDWAVTESELDYWARVDAEEDDDDW